MITDIKDVKQYNEIVTAFQKAHAKAATNCFLMPAELRSLAEANKLWLISQGDILLVLCERLDYFNVYYYIAQGAGVPDFSEVFDVAGEGDVLIDVVVPERMRGKTDPVIEAMLESGAIKAYKSYQRMSFPMEGLNAADYDCPLPAGYHFAEAVTDPEAVIDLWKLALDEKSTPLPDANILQDLFDEGSLFLVLGEEGDIACAAMLTVQGKHGLVQHVSVALKHRRKGLGGCIMKLRIKRAIELGLRTLRLWVDRQNTPGITLQTKEGFSPDGMICDQYIIERK